MGPHELMFAVFFDHMQPWSGVVLSEGGSSENHKFFQSILVERSGFVTRLYMEL